MSDKVLYFDVETVHLAEEVENGWFNIEAFGFACGIVYDSDTKKYHRYTRKNLKQMVEHLHAGDLLVGHNSVNFDCRVINGTLAYKSGGSGDLRYNLPHFDLMQYIQQKLGHRLSLKKLTECNLPDEHKLLHASEAPILWREGEYEKIFAYCQKDVELTKKLFCLACKTGILRYTTTQGDAAVCNTSNWAEVARETVETWKLRRFF